jgi:hypothetical protein
MTTLRGDLLIAVAVALALTATGYLVTAAVYGWETANALPLWAPLLVFTLVVSFVVFWRAGSRRPLLGLLTRLELGRSEADMLQAMNHELNRYKDLKKTMGRDNLTDSTFLRDEMAVSQCKIEVFRLALGLNRPRVMGKLPELTIDFWIYRDLKLEGRF